MKFDWNYYIANLLKRSDAEDTDLNAYAGKAVQSFDLLDGEFIYGLRELSTPEYGYWLVNNGVDSLLDYNKDTKTLSRSVVVNDNFDSRIYHNVFATKNDTLEYFKVYGDSLVKVKITSVPDLKANIEIYNDVVELLNTVIKNFKVEDVEREWQYYDKVIHENLKKIGNARLFDIDVRTLNTILDSLKLIPDTKINIGHRDLLKALANKLLISEFIDKKIKEQLPKVKIK